MSSSYLFLITCILFFFSDSSFSLSETPSFLLDKKISYSLNLPEQSLLLALMSGYKENLPKTLLLKTGLYHLLTPSGMHLMPLAFLFRRKVLLAFFSIFIASLEGFFSLKRVLIFKIFRIFFSFSSLTSFYLTFLLDFFVGSFQESPISFNLSFLFFGLFLSKKSFMQPFSLWINLIRAQFLVAYFLQGFIYPLSCFTNFLLTPLFLKLFPWIFFNYWFSFSFLQDFFVEMSMNYLYKLLQLFSFSLKIKLYFFDLLFLFFPKKTPYFLLFRAQNLF